MYTREADPFPELERLSNEEFITKVHLVLTYYFLPSGTFNNITSG